MKSITVLSSFLAMLPGVLPAAVPSPGEAPDTSLAALATRARPGFLLGSFASGLDFTRGTDPARAEFFRHHFNILTAGIYMPSTQPRAGEWQFARLDRLVDFATEHRLKVHLHPLIGGEEYTPAWVNEGGFPADSLRRLMRERITTILQRYAGRVHYVDVVNEPLSGNGRHLNGAFRWQEKAWKGGDHVWFKTLGMWRGQRHEFPRYLVESFRIAREVAGPEVRLILNDWGNETVRAIRGRAFLRLVQALREERVPVDAAGLQLHCRIRDGVFRDWRDQPFDFAAFQEMLALYADAGIEVHITEFDIHLPPHPTRADFELQGESHAEILKHALQSPAVKSFTTWGFTDAAAWKADGVDGHPLMLDEQLRPKPAYRHPVRMLRHLEPIQSP